MLDYPLTFKEAQQFWDENHETMSDAQKTELCDVMHELEDNEAEARVEQWRKDAEWTIDDVYDLRHARSCAVPSRI